MTERDGRLQVAGLDDFWAVTKELKRFWAFIVTGAALPLIANLAAISPPWPTGISTITSIALVISTVLAYQSMRSNRPGGVKVTSSLRRWGVWLAFLAIAYLTVFSLFTYHVPKTDVVFVKGFSCTQFVAEIDQCPFLSDEILKKGSWDPALHWTLPSITAVRIALVTLWLGSFFSLSALLSGFIVFWRMRRAELQADRKP